MTKAEDRAAAGRAEEVTRDELERRVAERTAELSRANEELQAAVRKLQAHESARLMFVDNASHELRTPLAAMTYTTGNLLQGIAGPLPDRVREYLNIFKEECRRMVTTVTRILDLSRIDADTVELHRMKTPLYRFTQSAVEEMQGKAEDRSLVLDIAPPDAATGFVHVDPLRLGHVLTCVLENAIEFTPEGGRIDVEVQLIRETTWMQVTVTDGGPGISPEDLPQLTQRYFRVGDFVKGTGLGLAFSKEIIDLHGGELEVTSPPPDRPCGTRVSIRLPRVEAPTVMAVDDSATIRLLIKKQLVERGYRVHSCENAEAALEALQASPPDMIVVDSVMPGMHGVDLISRVKAVHELRPIPILMLTGAELDRPTRNVLEDFAVPVLGKPWREDELIRCLEDAIYGKRYLQG